MDQCPVESYPDQTSACQPCEGACLTFSQDRYAVSFSEATPLDTVIVTVSAEDRRQLGRPVGFAITAGNEGREFRIDQDSGVVTLAVTLDRELQASHMLVVTALDTGTDPASSQSATVTVLVSVEDSNDNPPVFTGEPYTTFVQENLPSGASLLTVQAADADSAPNAMVTYSFAPDTFPGLFYLNSSTGELLTMTVLDFESQSVYTLTVVATDSGDPPLSSLATVTVLVGDENDIRPTFDPTTYSLTLSELTPVGSFVLQLQAMDTDTSNITYEVTEGNTGGVFQIDSTAGLLSIALSLDYEAMQEYMLTVVVADGFPNPLPSGTASVFIALQDENDNSPMFNQTSYSATVSENAPPTTPILPTLATDRDSGNNSLLLYTILEADAATVFAINSSGVITTLTALDYELQSVYSFTVVAMDQGSPALSSSAAVTVVVADLNDNPPVFTEDELVANFTEDHPTSSVIAAFRATDDDSGSNAALLYQLLNSTAIPFSIDPLRGDVVLNEPLDFEQLSGYVVTVVASDGGLPALTATATLFVYVVDVNDNAPQFSAGEYSATVSESLEVGTPILTVDATDADSGTNAVIVYEIVTGNQGGVFAIDGQTGEVTLASLLDFEQQTVYTITVSASNAQPPVPLASTVTLQIAVSETNEHPPVFSQDTYQANLLENEPNGTFVAQLLASDLDSGPSGDIAFEIVEGAQGVFEVSSDDGVIRTMTPVDREQQMSFVLTVRARDGGTPSFSATAVVEVSVLDLNDNPPQFSVTTPYVATLTENSPEGTVIVTTPPLMATDTDGIGPNSEVTYAIVDGDPNGLFTVGTLSGQLQSNGGVDFESVGEFELIVSATDRGSPSLSSVATIEVEILDQNDNQPLVANLTSTLVFIEGQGQLLLSPSVIVMDPDSLALQQITISLVGQTGDSLSLPSRPPGTQISPQRVELPGPFSTEEASAFLRTLTFINNEDEPSSFTRQVEIIVFDGTFSDTTSIEIVFSLVNDNRPFVDLDTNSSGSGFEAAFVEEGVPVSLTGATVAISDSDSEAVGLVSLVIELTNPLDGTQEGISVSRPLNSELEIQYGINNHSVTLTASPMASFTAFESVLSTLSYFNLADEPRAPLEREVRVTAFDGLLESDPAATARIEVVLFNDPPILDLGQQVDYRVEFIEGRGPVGLVSPTAFSLTDSDSVLLVNATVFLLNSPDSDGESLGIEEASTGNSTNITIIQTPFSIVIEDPAPLGDVAAVLLSVTYDNTLASPSAEQRLIEFAVSDGISVSTAMTFVTFSLVNDPPVIDLSGPQQGLDFETEFFEGSPPIPVASPDVSVRDVDSPFLQSALIQLIPSPGNEQEEGLDFDVSLVHPSLVVTSSPGGITVEGEAAPDSYTSVFASITYFNVAEEPVPGVRLVTFFVSDGSNSSTALSTIVVQSVNDPPTLIINEGQLFTATYVEESSSAAIVNPEGIVLTDNDNTLLAHVSVTVRNVQDGTAEILGFIDPSMDGSLIVNPRDVNAQERIYILSFSDNSSILENFHSLISSLSYRSTSLEPTAGVREIEIVVSDGADSSNPPQLSTVNVTLLNDNAPLFQQLFFITSVPENRVGVPVVTLRATDADDNAGLFADQGTIVYDIIGGNDDGFFVVDQLSGVITLLRPKDREATTAGAVLTVQATNPAPLDNQLVFYPTAFVVVSVTDENDNAPVFINETYEFQLYEDVQVEHVVGSVKASDADVGENGRITYSISQGNTNSAFQIDPNSGEITVADDEVLDRELIATYLLLVTAMDNGQPTISNTTTVAIAILDVNDNPPTFSEPVYFGMLTEFSSIGTPVVNVSASDRDTDSNITFFLDGTSSFSIDSTTGEVRTAAPLDHEAQGIHNFSVVATDGELASVAQVVVSVLDENDHFPVFLQPSYSASVLESLPVGQLVLIVSAQDGDDGTNAEISYAINASVPFTIEQTSGIVRVSEAVDREEREVYEFNVTARDGGQPPLEAFVSVRIVITDVNDNAPEFSQSEYTVEISEAVRLLTVVATVTASDADTGSNREIVYTLVGGAGIFQVDPAIGEVFTIAEVDREGRESYELEITASDQGSPPLTSRTTLFVNISDVNDNAPVFTLATYQFTVAENVAAGGIGSVSASDLDANENAFITYSLDNDLLPFIIDEVSGQLSTSLPLDREATASYSLTVVATDSGLPPLSSNATITVIVGDSNDFTPSFPEGVYNLTIPEDEPLTPSLLSLAATDLDAGSNAIIAYQILPGGTNGISSIFALNSQTGQLQLIGSLNAETVSFYSFSVVARDGGSPSRSSTASVEIAVTDVNDNSVQLSLGSPLTAVYMEESSPVAIAPNATVQDDDVSALVVNVTVELTGTRGCCEDHLVFPIDDVQLPGLSSQLTNDDRLLLIKGPSSLALFTAALRTVGYVNSNSEPLGGTITARFTVSDGLFSSTGGVTITIVPINDNPPTVLLDGGNISSSVTFTENAPGVMITGAEVMITDADSNAVTLDSITVHLVSAVDGNSQEFLTVPQSGGEGGVSVFPTSGQTLTLTGPANFSDFVFSLSAVRYQNLAEDPQKPLQRMIEVVPNDGDNVGFSSFAVVTVVPVNDPPSLQLGVATLNHSVVFTERGEPVTLASPNLLISDPDSQLLMDAIVTLLDAVDEGNEQLLFQLAGSTALNFTRLSLISVRVIGPGTLSEFASSLRGISYTNNATDPSPLPRIVQFSVSDGDLLAVAFTEVSIFVINDPPMMDLNGLLVPGTGVQVEFTEGGSPVSLLSEQLSIEDSDDDLLASVSVTILPPRDGTAESFLVSPQGGINATFCPEAGTLTLFGLASFSDYRATLLTLQYLSLADEPSGGQRRLQFIASDGQLDSEPAIATVTFILVNDPPVVILDTGGDFSTFYEENSPAIPLVNPRSARITDPDSPNLFYLFIQIQNALDGELELLNYSSPVEGLVEIQHVVSESHSQYYNLSFPVPMPLSVFSDLLLSLTYENLALEPNASLPRVVSISTSDGEQDSAVAVATVTIALRDDNQPQFLMDMYSFDVLEDVAPGSQVGVVLATDADLGDTFLYQLIPSGSPFTINSLSGVISLQDPVDRETQSSFSLTAQLMRDLPPFSVFDSEAAVTVTVRDVNDNTPMFNETSFSFSVLEDIAAGTTVATLTATDPDEGANADLLYSLEGTAVLSIVPLTGAVVTTQTLDREAVSTIEFAVSVRDGGQPQRSSQVGVTLSVLDVNDNAPVFSQPTYFTQLVETAPVDTSILQVSASDGDSGLNAEISYRLLPEVAQLSLNPSTGVLTISNPLAPGTYIFAAIATDSGSHALSSEANLTIEIISFNSTLPFFSQSSYEGTIPEDADIGTSVLIVAAVDPISENPVRYSIATQGTFEFSLDPSTGRLTTNATLDRESRDVYQFQVTATSDDGTREGVTQVVVRLSDVNDFAPEFLQPVYTFVAEENVPLGSTLGAVLALDTFDTGSNAQVVSYILSSDNFTISSTGVITTALELDREILDLYTFEVYAADGGSPSLVGTGAVVVQVLDVNDNPPEFSRAVYEANVDEGLAIASFVTVVSASDRDDGNSGEIRFFTNSTVFSIDTQSGEVATLAVLDFETNPYYEVTVVAIDDGQPQLSSSAAVLISVGDIDDMPPQFTMATYMGSVLEEQSSTNILTVVALDSDSDSSNPILYDIISSDDDIMLLFTITQAGNISTLLPLDREGVSQYSLTVRASNLDATGSTLSSTATVLIEVLDANDHAPLFLGEPYVFMISEDAEGGEFVGTLAVTDLDEGDNARISQFEIVSGDPQGYFTIEHQSGTLRVAESAVLDRETEDEFFLGIRVTDAGNPPLSSNSTVVIRLTDVNDNSPMFIPDTHNITVREDTAIATIILSPMVSDGDLGSNANLTFSLIQDGGGTFSIDPTTGKCMRYQY